MAAYEHTLGDAKQSYLRSISGVCTSADQFTEWVNEAQERLIDAGNWFGTEWLAKMCLFNGCLVLPRQFGTLLGFRRCGASFPIKNHWWSIVGPANECCNSISDFQSPQIIEQNTVPTFRPVSGNSGSGAPVRVVATKIEDYGKTVTIFGVSSTGQPLQHKEGGIWRPGIKMKLQSPYFQTDVNVRRIDSVLKDETQGDVVLYEWDSTNSQLHMLSRYEASETNPRYRSYRIRGLCIENSRCETDEGDKWKQVEVLVKLNFVPVKNDNDFLVIDNFPALKFMLQAIRQEEAGQTTNGETFEAKAIRQMNLRDRNKMPNMQTAIVIDATPIICNAI